MLKVSFGDGSEMLCYMEFCGMKLLVMG